MNKTPQQPTPIAPKPAPPHQPSAPVTQPKKPEKPSYTDENKIKQIFSKVVNDILPAIASKILTRKTLMKLVPMGFGLFFDTI